MSLSAASVIAEQYDALNATSADDLVFWTVDDLYAWFDESIKQLARTAPGFVEAVPETLSAGAPVYANPARHVKLIALLVGGNILLPASARELAALSDTWQTDTAVAPSHWIQDWEGHDYHRVYPTPTAGATVQVILARFPEDITALAPTVAAPVIVGDYAALRMIAEARRAEGDGALPEISAHLDQECGLLERVFQAYWGAL